MLKTLFDICKKDCRSTTGSNIHGCLSLLSKTDFGDLNKDDFNSLSYYPLSDDDQWKKEFFECAIAEKECGTFNPDDNDLFSLICIN